MLNLLHSFLSQCEFSVIHSFIHSFPLPQKNTHKLQLKMDNFPNQARLWPKPGEEETVILSGTLINYHTDCLLIFLYSV